MVVLMVYACVVLVVLVGGLVGEVGGFVVVLWCDVW